LDEPTNHLDMHSKDVLLEALKDFGGTVIFVSHDRGFIEGLATRVLELKPGSFRNFLGGYEYYMQRLEDEAAGLLPVAGSDSGTSSPSARSDGESAPVSEGKASWEEMKKAESERRKLQKAVDNLEEQIAATEDALKEEQNKMANPDVYSNGEKAKAVQKKIDELNARLDELNIQWEEAAEAVEALG